MKIIVSHEHVQDFDEMESYAIEKVSKLEKFHPKIEKITVHLIAKKSHRDNNQDYYCEINVDIPGKNIEIVDVESSTDKAIDKAVERLKRSLVKDKEKKITKEHKAALKRKSR